MNKFIFMGRLTKEPQVTKSNPEMPMARFTLAVDKFSKDNKDAADFIQITAFGRQATFAENYLTKGTKVLVEGRVQTGSYENKDKVKVYTTDFVANTIEFCEKKTTDTAEDPGEIPFG